MNRVFRYDKRHFIETRHCGVRGRERTRTRARLGYSAVLTNRNASFKTARRLCSGCIPALQHRTTDMCNKKVTTCGNLTIQVTRCEAEMSRNDAFLSPSAPLQGFCARTRIARSKYK